MLTLNAFERAAWRFVLQYARWAVSYIKHFQTQHQQLHYRFSPWQSLSINRCISALKAETDDILQNIIFWGYSPVVFIADSINLIMPTMFFRLSGPLLFCYSWLSIALSILPINCESYSSTTHTPTWLQAKPTIELFGNKEYSDRLVRLTFASSALNHSYTAESASQCRLPSLINFRTLLSRNLFGRAVKIHHTYLDGLRVAYIHHKPHRSGFDRRPKKQEKIWDYVA